MRGAAACRGRQPIQVVCERTARGRRAGARVRVGRHARPRVPSAFWCALFSTAPLQAWRRRHRAAAPRRAARAPAAARCSGCRTMPGGGGGAGPCEAHGGGLGRCRTRSRVVWTDCRAPRPVPSSPCACCCCSRIACAWSGMPAPEGAHPQSAAPRPSLQAEPQPQPSQQLQPGKGIAAVGFSLQKMSAVASSSQVCSSACGRRLRTAHALRGAMRRLCRRIAGRGRPCFVPLSPTSDAALQRAHYATAPAPAWSLILPPGALCRPWAAPIETFSRLPLALPAQQEKVSRAHGRSIVDCCCQTWGPDISMRAPSCAGHVRRCRCRAETRSTKQQAAARASWPAAHSATVWRRHALKQEQACFRTQP